jgi:hypothetical protein
LSMLHAESEKRFHVDQISFMCVRQKADKSDEWLDFKPSLP